MLVSRPQPLPPLENDVALEGKDTSSVAHPLVKVTGFDEIEVNTNQLRLNVKGASFFSEELNIPAYGTAARDLLSSVAGDVIYNSDTSGFEGFDGTSWLPLSGSGSGSLLVDVIPVLLRTSTIANSPVEAGGIPVDPADYTIPITHQIAYSIRASGVVSNGGTSGVLDVLNATTGLSVLDAPLTWSELVPTVKTGALSTTIATDLIVVISVLGGDGVNDTFTASATIIATAELLPV